MRCGAWGPAGAGGHGALAQQHRVSHTILNLNTTTTTHLAQQQVHVLNTSHPGLQLLRPLLGALLLLLDQPDLVVDGVQLLLQHAGQGLGVRLTPGREEVGQDGLTVISVSVHPDVIVPAVVHLGPPETVGGAPRQAAHPAAGLIPRCLTVRQVV